MSSKPTQIENMLAVVEILSRRIEELEAELAAVQKQRDSWQRGYGRVFDEMNEEREKWITAEAALAALRAEARWEPVSDGMVFYETERVYEEGFYSHEETIAFLEVRNGRSIACGSMPIEDEQEVDLPDNVAVCRLVPGQDTPAQGRIAELEAQLADAQRWTPTVNVETGQLTVGDPVVDEWLTPEEDAAWAHLQDTPAQEGSK